MVGTFSGGSVGSGTASSRLPVRLAGATKFCVERVVLLPRRIRAGDPVDLIDESERDLVRALEPVVPERRGDHFGPGAGVRLDERHAEEVRDVTVLRDQHLDDHLDDVGKALLIDVEVGLTALHSSIVRERVSTGRLVHGVGDRPARGQALPAPGADCRPSRRGTGHPYQRRASGARPTR